MKLSDYIAKKREDAKAEDLGDKAMAATMKAHKSEDEGDHKQAAFLHARAADEHTKKGNFAQAFHHQEMAKHHRDECGPDSAEEGPPSSKGDY